MSLDPRLDAPMPAGSLRIVVTCLEEANAAWRMLRQQQVIHRAAILVTSEPVWFSAERVDQRWQLTRLATPRAGLPPPTVG